MTAPLRLSAAYLQHPCPRQRHHPGEQCACALRLDVCVPHGYSRAGDLGSLHDARLQNLRWRVSSLAFQTRTSTGPDSPRSPRDMLPPSLYALAQDRKGDAAKKSIRPLSPEGRLPPRALHIRPHAKTWTRCREGQSGDPNCNDSSDQAATPEKTPESPHMGLSVSMTTLPDCREFKKFRPRVSFCEQIECQVPVIKLSANRHLLKVHKSQRTPTRRRTHPAPEGGTAEELTRRNFENLMANHNQVSKHFEHCFAFLLSANRCRF
mmetsp:Transcript_19223/g.34204  ORF Transcript_19223/g.34204 Transcript_19223/m.34204 type:complete len:265 (+) Transcript_19223:124-918(+)